LRGAKAGARKATRGGAIAPDSRLTFGGDARHPFGRIFYAEGIADLLGDINRGIRFNYINTGETDAEVECIEAHVFRSRRDEVSFENRSLIKCDYDRNSLSSGESGLEAITWPDDFDGHETTDD
jgi:hypothetical protein